MNFSGGKIHQRFKGGVGCLECPNQPEAQNNGNPFKFLNMENDPHYNDRKGNGDVDPGVFSVLRMVCKP